MTINCTPDAHPPRSQTGPNAERGHGDVPDRTVRRMPSPLA